MSETEYLLVCLMEECSEVIHRTSKALRFGLGEVERGQAKANDERLWDELNDLLGVVGTLEREFIINRLDPRAFREKHLKIERMMQYSKECGTLKEDD